MTSYLPGLADIFHSRDSPQLPTNDTTVKYVCCGGCRQWLVAPKTALYVVCSRCDAVNNCNIPSAPAETLPSVSCNT